jgi:hypothetical protein
MAVLVAELLDVHRLEVALAPERRRLQLQEWAAISAMNRDVLCRWTEDQRIRDSVSRSASQRLTKRFVALGVSLRRSRRKGQALAA